MTDIENVSRDDKTKSSGVRETVVNMRDIQLAGGMRLSKWCATVGISRTAAWRLRRSGKLQTVTRYGISYVTAKTIQEFFTNDGSTVRRPCASECASTSTVEKAQKGRRSTRQNTQICSRMSRQHNKKETEA